MSKTKEFRLTPVRIFLGTVLLVVLGATLYDGWNRKSTRVVDVTEDTEIPLDEMDLNDLRIRFDSIQLANSELRPSTMLALEDRIAIARMMVTKSQTPGELVASRVHLMKALLSSYVLRRDNKLEFTAVRDEFVEVVDQVISENTGPDRLASLLLGFEVETHRILDGTQTAETLERTQLACDTIGREFFDLDTATEIEKFLIPLSIKSGIGPEADEVFGQVSRLFSTHPDKNLQDWSDKLADDVVFRRLDLFEIHKKMNLATPGSANEFLKKLDELFEQTISPIGYGRLIGFCRDLDAQDEYAITLEGYRRIEQHISQPALIEQNRENIDRCRNGIKRIESLGNVVQGEFIDVHGRRIDLDAKPLKNCPILVLAVSALTELVPAITKTISVSHLASRNIRVVVVCIGMDAEKVKQEFGQWLNDDFHVVADPNSNSLFYSACPTESTPAIWVLSRDHKLLDFYVQPGQLPGIIEALTFTR